MPLHPRQYPVDNGDIDGLFNDGGIGFNAVGRFKNRVAFFFSGTGKSFSGRPHQYHPQSKY
ncbi:MAG: hypothetical protein R2861_03425 [Desulfobacterales bacterium]